MRFLYPEFLYALLALAIPIIIHLFNFRRFKRVVFPNTRFLEEVELQTRSKSRLKHLLVLLSRLLAVAALVFAFARPFMPTDNSSAVVGRKAVSVYIDNSFSMEQEDESGPLLQQAKALAEDIVKGYDQSDRFQLLTNDFEGRHQRLTSQEECLELIAEVTSSPTVRRLSDVQQRMSDVLSREEVAARRAFMISDLQRSTTDIPALSNDSTISSNIVPLEGNELGNVYIDSVWFSTPVRQLNADEQLTVRVVNASRRSLDNLPIRVMINGEQKAIGNVSLLPLSTSDSVLYFSNTQSGVMEGYVSIDDHPITFDDRYHFSYTIADKLSVMLISSAQTSRVASLYRDDAMFDLTQSRPDAMDYAVLADQDLVVLQDVQSIKSGMVQELMKFVENGGSLIVLPANDADISSYNELYLALGANTISELSTADLKVSDIEEAHPIFSGVFDRLPSNMDLPVVKRYYQTFKRSQSREQRLMSLQNGQSFASAFPSGEGMLYTFAVGSSAEMSNFTRHSFFVTTLLRMAEMSQGKEQIAYTVGEDEMIEVRFASPLADEQFHLVQTDGPLDILPERRDVAGRTELFLHSQVKESGAYRLTFADEHLRSYAFNYSRQESRMDFVDKETLEGEMDRYGLNSFKMIEAGPGGFDTSMEQLSEGRSLWRWFIIAALIFLAIEVLLLKFMPS